MNDSFDPYYKWLAIPPDEQPPSHYRLLGLRPLEGDPDELFSLIRQMQDAIFDAGAERVSTVVKMDDRRDGEAIAMESKVESALSKLASRRGEQDL